MKLSIIVPVYNMASDGKLNYCLDSLAAQTISDYEVITVDDASTDESFSILLEYEKKYPGKFKAVHSEVNKRQGGAKNIGLSLAKGEWIGFIDSDDWILPTMYEKLIGRAEETGADMVGCDYCLTDEHSMKIGKPGLFPCTSKRRFHLCHLSKGRRRCHEAGRTDACRRKS